MTWKPTPEMVKTVEDFLIDGDMLYLAQRVENALSAVQPLIAAEALKEALKVAMECPLPDDPHTDAWTLGFLRAKSIIDLAIYSLIPKPPEDKP